MSGDEPAIQSTPLPGAVEIAHVLFTDLVGYSLLPMDQQKEYLGQLQKIVRQTPQFRASDAHGDIISLPTGDGMALAFFRDPTAPAQCALEIASALNEKPHLKLRMGIHSGPVYRVADVNANTNLSGGGINMAQRVMDCGDAGHIIVSKSTADVLLQLNQWSPHLADLGECTVKHGVKIHLWSLSTAEVGKSERPRKLGRTVRKARRTGLVVAAMAFLAATVAGAFWLGGIGRSSQSDQGKPSIAVLPFLDMSPEKDQAYFSDGVAEELLNALSRIPGLRVAGRTSSFQFRDKIEDFAVIGQKLNVSTILEGSVRKQGNRARITTQLVQAADGFNLWSDTYEREMTDIFGVQEEIAQAVAGEMKVKLLGRKTAARGKGPTGEAYNNYLQGQYLLDRPNKQNLQTAVAYFERAIALDPSYAPAWSELGESRSRQAGMSAVSDGYPKAREAVAQALTLDPDLGEAHAAMGWIELVHEWDWARADTSFRRALALEPGNARTISRAGALARTLGRWDQSIALFQRAIRIDPLNPVVYYNAGLSFYYARRPDEATAAVKRALELAPEMAVAHFVLTRIYLSMSRPQQALAEAEREKDLASRLWGLALAHHALGRKRESDEDLAELVAKFSAEDQYQIATVFAFRGEKDQALRWLERAYTERDPGISETKGDPLLQNLERDPRFTAFTKKLHL